jgi:repressor LexA
MSPKTPPGQTREQVFQFVKNRLNEGLPPTVREVQEAFQFRSVRTAGEHLFALVEEGRLVKHPGVSRGYRLPEGAASLHGFRPVPLLGRVQAGLPTLPLEEVEDYVPVKGRDTEDLFALRVRGDSMKNAGILQGDVVIVRSLSEAMDGDIVVALVGEEATVKRLGQKGGRVALYPENPDFEPIVSPNIAIIGKVIEVRRTLEVGRREPGR